MARFKIVIYDEDLGEDDTSALMEDSFLSESNEEEIAEAALRLQRVYNNRLDAAAADWSDF